MRTSCLQILRINASIFDSVPWPSTLLREDSLEENKYCQEYKYIKSILLCWVWVSQKWPWAVQSYGLWYTGPRVVIYGPTVSRKISPHSSRLECKPSRSGWQAELIILYFSILLHCIVQWVLQVMFPSACCFIVCWFPLFRPTWPSSSV
jgi:hypothetical protein